MFIKDHTDVSGRFWGADRIIANDNGGKQRPRTKMGAENREFGLSRIEFQSIWGHPIAYVVDAASNLVVVKWPDGFESNDMFIYESLA